MLDTEKIINAGSDGLMSACRRLCSGTKYSADDLFQDTVLLFMERNNKGKIPEYKSGLLPTMAKCIIIDMIRRDKRRFNISMPIHEGRDAACHDPSYELVSDIELAISMLSEEQAKVLGMRVDGYSFEEIAASTNVSVNTAVGRMRYARKKIAKSIK